MAKYPAAIPTLDEIFKVTNWVDWVKGEEWNDLRAELRAVLVELGTLPKGASADVKTRLGTLALKANVLELDNVTPFTPDADHEPATKKYVDDKEVAGFTDRGDPAASDWTQATLTTDGDWHDLDLSSIVPSGAKAVALSVLLRDDLANQFIKFRKKGNSELWNVGQGYTQSANLWYQVDFIVACDTNRVIEYYATNTVWTNIYITVKGWWM